jgi:hypothetical protein
MNQPHRLSRPSWNSNESRSLRPELWLVAAVVVAMMLVEVWQSSKVTEQSLALGRSRQTLQQAQARRDAEQAVVERLTTRTELEPVATQLGLVPADPRQVVNLSSDFLADAGVTEHGTDAVKPGITERIASMVVPEARARGRSGN